MHPHGTAAVQGAGRVIGDAVYVGGGSRSDFTPAAINMSGFLPGQMMLVYAYQNLTITGGASGDWVYGAPDAMGYRFGTKVLQTPDLAGLAFSAPTYMSAWAVYSGPIVFSQRLQANGYYGSQTSPGITKGGWCARLVLGIRGNNPQGGWQAPNGWTFRHGSGGSGTSGSVVISDIAPGDYVNNTTLSFGGSGGSFAATLQELLNY